MANRRLWATQKRHQNTNNHQPKKRKRSDTEPTDTTTITDVNNDCLEHIFKYLELSDLLNVADSSKCFKPTVDLIVASRYRKMRVCLRNIRPSRKQSIDLSKSDYDILITNITTCLKFLRCFGHLIDSLHLDYHGCTRYHRAKVDQYVNEYCAESLREIFIQGASKWAMDSATKPFSQVQYVQFKNCQLGDTLSDLNKWFPIMYSLKFNRGNQTTDQKFIAKRFQHLKRLLIEEYDKYLFGPDNVAQALRLNPQLKKICICGDCFDAKFLQSNNMYLQYLDGLKIAYNNENCLNLGNDTIFFGNIKRFAVLLYPTKVIQMPRIPFSFDQLEQFTIYVRDVVVLGGSFRNFIVQNPSMSKLILRSHNEHEHFDPLGTADKIKLAKAAVSLKQINIIGIRFSIEETIDFINESKSMKKFVFQLQAHLDFDVLKKRLDKQWNASIDTGGFINLER